MDSIRYEFMDEIYNHASNWHSFNDNHDILLCTKSVLKFRKILFSGMVNLLFYISVLVVLYSGIFSSNATGVCGITSVYALCILGVGLSMCQFLLICARMKIQRKWIKYILSFAVTGLNICIIEQCDSHISFMKGYSEDNRDIFTRSKLFMRILINFHIFLSQFIMPFCLNLKFIFTLLILILNAVLFFNRIPALDNFSDTFHLDIFLFAEFTFANSFFKLLQKYLLKQTSTIAFRNDRAMKYIDNLINKMFCQFFAFTKGKVVFTNQSAKSFLKSKFHMVESDREDIKPIKFIQSVQFVYFNSSIDSIICNDDTISHRGNMSLMKIISQFESNSHENHLFYFLGIIEYVDPISNERYYFNVFIRRNEIEQSSWIEVMMYDITLAKRIEIIDETIKLKEKLLSKIAHEFKTPLICIISLAEELEASFREKPTVGEENANVNVNVNVNMITSAKKKIRQVNNLSNYTLYLLNDIAHYLNNNTKNLEYVLHNINTQNFYGNKPEENNNKTIQFSQPVATDMQVQLEENVSVNDILQFAYRILKTLLISNKNKIKYIVPVKKFTHRNDIFIKTDPIRLKQILLNLLSNSVKFTQSGKIELKSSYDEDQQNLVLSVEDTGIGIKSEDLDKIFIDYKMLERHRGLNYMGTGLGLSISDHIAKLLGYKMKVTSEVGVGSIFSVVIPLLPGKMNEREEFTKHTVHKMLSSPNLTKFRFKKDEDKTSMFPAKKKSKSRKDLDVCIQNNPKTPSKFKPVGRTKKYSDMSIKIKNINSSNTVSNINIVHFQDQMINYDTTIHLNCINDHINQRIKYTKEASSENSDETVKKEFACFDISYIRKLQSECENNDEIEKIDEMEMDISIDDSTPSNKILIIDDNVLILSTLENLIKRIFEKNKFNQDTPLDIIKGYDGVDLLKEIIEDQKFNRIKCIFTDERMEFINGSEAIRMIHELMNKNKIRPVPMVVMSASELREFSYVQEESTHPVIYLSKPVKEEEIVEVLFKFGILIGNPS